MKNIRYPSFLSFRTTSALTCMALCTLSSQAQESIGGKSLSGFIELGASQAQLTEGYAPRSSAFVRGELQGENEQRINFEIANISEFSDQGTLLSVAYFTNLDSEWIAQGNLSTSSGGNTLPRIRADVGVGHKWLDQKNLVTTVELSRIQYKDVHTDTALQGSVAYYFEHSGTPLAIESGLRYNVSDPGAVGATSQYVAVTAGREQDRVISLRIGSGRESYQLVDSNVALVGFKSNDLLLTWRQWFDGRRGIQLRLDTYQNPYYSRTGIEASWFQSF